MKSAEDKNRGLNTFKLLKVFNFMPKLVKIISFFFKLNHPSLPVNCFGLDFSNPVGVASGIDKNGEYYNAMSSFGPSFIEIGPMRNVVPAIRNIQRSTSSTIIFANLSNFDIERSFSRIYDFVDVIVLNVSNHSTIASVIDRLITLRRYNDDYRPILFKLAPEMDTPQIEESITYILSSGLDGVMAPVGKLSEVLSLSKGMFPVIAYGEFKNVDEVKQALESGAALVALRNRPLKYGPFWVKKILKSLIKK